jgi:cytochrome c oxidase subunit 4
MSGHIVPVRTYVGIFVVLLFLTGLTTGVAFIDIGSFHTGVRLLDAIPLNTVVALTIAVAKMLLVILFFMHVKYSSGLTKIVVLAGFFFLALLVAFTLADELTRHWSPTPSGWSAIFPFLHFLS